MKRVSAVLAGVASFLTVCFTCSSFHQITAAPIIAPPPPVLTVSPAIQLQDRLDNVVSEKKVEFLPSSVSLTNDSYSILKQVAGVLLENPAINIEIQGHTDNVGPEESNKTISEWRAGEVREYLIHKGVAPERLTRVGYGSSRPIADNETEEGRKQNRRINFLVLGGI
jgi:OmpA-OmpF porin, OOP family